jgi:hypothetical protein
MQHEEKTEYANGGVWLDLHNDLRIRDEVLTELTEPIPYDSGDDVRRAYEKSVFFEDTKCVSGAKSRLYVAQREDGTYELHEFPGSRTEPMYVSGDGKWVDEPQGDGPDTALPHAIHSTAEDEAQLVGHIVDFLR